jgi:hypothetical protein
MRTIAYALALALGVAFATSAFAADVTTAKTKADCDKVGGMWDAKTNTCKSKMRSSPGQSPGLLVEPLRSSPCSKVKVDDALAIGTTGGCDGPCPPR